MTSPAFVLLIVLAVACAARLPTTVTVSELLRHPQNLTGREVVLAGRALNVRDQRPDGTAVGTSFRLVDGTGELQVVHEVRLDLPSGSLVRTRGRLARRMDGEWELVAKRIWLMPGARAP